MTLSAAVMAHPHRADMVAELLEQLDRPVPVVWDEINDRHDTGGRAVAAFDPTCTHHLVLQDDIVPAPDLLAGVERALEGVPQDVPVSLYIGRVAPFRKTIDRVVTQALDGASWITMEGIYWGPALVLPTVHLPALLRWYEKSRVLNYDRRLSTWFQAHGLRCWYTWPSLVEHRGDRSLAHASTARRRAHRFVEGSALDVDWSMPVIDVPGTVAMDRARQREAQRALAG